MKKNQKGFTLIEMVVAGLILSSVIYVASSSFKFMFGEMKRTAELSEKRAVIANLMKTIRNNPKLYQAHFVNLSDDTRESKLQAVNSPLAWNMEGIYERSKCPSCLGLLSILIEPNPVVQGAFTLQMRVFEKKQNGAYEHSDYYMIFGD